MSKFPQRLKDRRDIGQVIFPIEQLMAVRELSSCCAGQEAILESGVALLRFPRAYTEKSLERENDACGSENRPAAFGSGTAHAFCSIRDYFRITADVAGRLRSKHFGPGRHS